MACGRTMGHGESCVKDRECDVCYELKSFKKIFKSLVLNAEDDFNNSSHPSDEILSDLIYIMKENLR